jgi:catechol 2,3-dioxygenase-like lactoylglutathione lyase family enzyme
MRRGLTVMAIEITGLDHVVLRTRKLDEVLAFYRDKLGFPVERTIEPIGLYQLRAGSALVDVLDVNVFTVAEAGPGESLYDHFCLAVRATSADELAAALDAAGIPHGDAAERYGATGYGASFYVNDPDGRTVELKISGARA